MGAPTLSRSLATIPAVLLLVFGNVLISTTIGMVVQVLMYPNYGKMALPLSIFISIIVYGFVAFNHKLRVFLKNQGESNEQ